MNTFRRRKCSVSSEQVSVSRLYPFGLQQEEAALTRPFCPAWPPSCPGGGGSKSTHGWITHTCICTCTKCCPGVCVRRWLKYINSFKNGFNVTNSTVCFFQQQSFLHSTAKHIFINLTWCHVTVCIASVDIKHNQSLQLKKIIEETELNLCVLLWEPVLDLNRADISVKEVTFGFWGHVSD